jgi:acetoin utilization protein AcuC
MTGEAGLVLCSGARAYDHGPGHPLNPRRFLLTWSLLEATGIDRAPGVRRLLANTPASDAELEFVHDRAFIGATRRAGHGQDGPWGGFGYGPGDNPIFSDMHEAAAMVAGATLTAARSVRRGEVAHAFNAAGGLHHAMPARASGFCVYDDVAVAIAWLLADGVERVAYVDIDVHHGDGPEAIFARDPRVLTVSIHEYAPELGFFPGTGGASREADGVVNVPMPPGTGDEAWLAALRERALPPVRAFAPEVLVTQFGCDGHRTDPLAHLKLTTAAYAEAARLLHELAHEAADGRWVATSGGGYQWASVAPRVWTLAFAEMADTDPPDALPTAWVREASELGGGTVPGDMWDPDGATGAAPKTRKEERER